MKLLDFLRNIPSRLRWNINLLTIAEFVYILTIPFMLKFADPALFTEGAWVENLQLLVLTAAFAAAVKAPRDKIVYSAGLDNHFNAYA